MSTQPSAALTQSPADRRAFADDVEYYLSLSPRQLPSRYLYDALGSALFEAICRLPWYGITRTEQLLLERHGGEILSMVDPIGEIVELGPGGGEKLSTLLAASGLSRKMRVRLVDISGAALAAASHSVGAHSLVEVFTHQGTYEAGLEELASIRPPKGQRLSLFLGSNIGNFDAPDADSFIRSIRRSLCAGDALLLGADLVRSERELLLAYDDPLGVTAAFNLNLLVRANRELDANFDLASFGHRAVWNAEESRVEMHLVSRRQQHVTVPASNLDIQFEEGETIWTESSYKYHPPAIVGLFEQARFVVVKQWIDDGFALTLGRAI